MMKKALILSSVLIFLTILLNTFNYQFPAMANSSGSPGNRTGSPGDGGLNCTGCHSGTVNSGNAQVSIITSMIPGSGYVPGQTYQISTSIFDSISPAFGFEVTAEDASNNPAGTFAANASGAPVKTILSNTSATHNGKAMNTGFGQMWVYDWTAPPAGTGPVTFYTAVNAVNNNFNITGDQVYTTSVTIQEDTGSSSVVTTNNDTGIKLYPNPFEHNLYLTNLRPQTKLTVYNLTGKKVFEQNFTNTNNIQKVTLENLSKGLYLLKLSQNNTIYEVQRIIKL